MCKTGNITIVEPTDNFTRINKDLIKNLDCEAVGIYCKIMVLGKTWKLFIDGLSKHLGISDARIRKAICKLEESGYVVRHAVRTEKGKMCGWNYFFYSVPVPEEKRTCAGRKKKKVAIESIPADLPKNRQDGEPTIRKSDKSENSKDNNIILNTTKDLIEYNTKESIEKTLSENSDSKNTRRPRKKFNPKGSCIISLDNQPEEREKNSAKREKFTPPTDKEVRLYNMQINGRVRCSEFIDYYQARGWEGIYDWKALFRTWVKNEKHPEEDRNIYIDDEYEAFKLKHQNKPI